MANKYYVVMEGKYYKKKGAGDYWYCKEDKDLAFQYRLETAYKVVGKLMLEKPNTAFTIEKV